MREQELSEQELQWLGPVAIAVFVDMGWADGWPLGLTPRGQAAARGGYGRDLLPIGAGQKAMLGTPDAIAYATLTVRPGGAYSWEGRKPFAPHGKRRRK